MIPILYRGDLVTRGTKLPLYISGMVHYPLVLNVPWVYREHLMPSGIKSCL